MFADRCDFKVVPPNVGTEHLVGLSAKTGTVDRNVCPGLRHVQLLSKDLAFMVGPRLLDAFDKPLQCPDIVGMLTAARKALVIAEVGAKGGFGFLKPVLFGQERTQGMTRWMHPDPGFGVVEPVVVQGCKPQAGEGSIIVLLSIFQLAIQHRLADPEHVAHGVAEKNRILGDGASGFLEGMPRSFRCVDVTERCLRDTLAVSMHLSADRT